MARNKLKCSDRRCDANLRIPQNPLPHTALYSGALFYFGDSAMLRHMRRTVELVLGESDNFLKAFKAYGWYLDDLVLTPVNHLTKSQRKARPEVTNLWIFRDQATAWWRTQSKSNPSPLPIPC